MALKTLWLQHIVSRLFWIADRTPLYMLALALEVVVGLL
jgi:hypothetical protein